MKWTAIAVKTGFFKGTKEESRQTKPHLVFENFDEAVAWIMK